MGLGVSTTQFSIISVVVRRASGQNLTDHFSEMSSGLDASHPHLNSKIQAHGLNNLEYCSIGPDSCYYARWKNGRACWEVPSDLNKWLHERAAEPDSVAIRAVSFGRDDAWIVKFTRASTPLICSRRVLRGHYKGLDQFINNPNRPSNLSVDVSQFC